MSNKLPDRRLDRLVTEQQREWNQQYRLKNLDKFKAYRRQHYLKTREKSIEYASRWNKEHADRVRNRARASYKVNVEKLRKTKREIRLKLLRLLGDRCVFCGYDKNELALQIDHIDGSGASDKRRFKGNATGYRYYLNHPEMAKDRLQILCANCNTIKRFEKREINHKYG